MGCTTVWLRILNKHKGLRKLFELGNTSGVQSQYSKRIKLILALLETAGTIDEMDLPDLKLHELRGDRSGIWSVKVGGNYRITFQIDAGDIYNVDYEDYALKGDFYENTQSFTPRRNNSGILRWSFGAQLQMELSYREWAGNPFQPVFFEMLMTSLINLKNAPVVLFKLKVFHKNIMVSCWIED